MVDEEDQKKIGKYRNKKRVALNLSFYIQSKTWFMIVQKQIQTNELNLVIAMYETRTR